MTVSEAVAAARQNVLALARQRKRHTYPDVDSAIRAGAITDTDWCDALIAARAEYEDGVAGGIDQAVLAFVKAQPGLCRADIAEQLGLSLSRTWQALDVLREQELIQTNGKRKPCRYYPADYQGVCYDYHRTTLQRLHWPDLRASPNRLLELWP